MIIFTKKKVTWIFRLSLSRIALKKGGYVYTKHHQASGEGLLQTKSKIIKSWFNSNMSSTEFNIRIFVFSLSLYIYIYYKVYPFPTKHKVFDFVWGVG